MPCSHMYSMHVALSRLGILVGQDVFEKLFDEIRARFVVTEKTSFAGSFAGRKPQVKKAYRRVALGADKRIVFVFPLNSVRFFMKMFSAGGREATASPETGAIIHAQGGLRMFPEPAAVEFGPPAVTLYEHQRLILEHALGLLPRRFGRLYLQLGTGMGKTFLGAALGGRLGVRMLVVTPTLEIRDFWVDEFRKMFPEANAEVFTNAAWDKIQGAAGTPLPDMMAGVVNSIRGRPADFYANFGLVVLDEAHEYYTPVNSNVLWGTPKYMVGLSATPEERPDQLDRFVFPFIGRPILGEDVPGVLEQIESITFRGTVRRVIYSAECPDVFSEEDSGGPGFQYMSTINNLIEDEYRTHVICLEVMRLLKQGHSLFVFAELREFLPRLQRKLAEFLRQTDIKYVLEIEDDDADVDGVGGKPRLDSTVLRGGCKHDDVEEAKNLRIVLTTYGFSRRGISITNMTGMVLATPRRNGLRQIVGRILRLGSDPATVRCVTDIVDKKSTLARQFLERKKVYDQKGYPITKFSISRGDEIPLISEYLK